ELATAGVGGAAVAAAGAGLGVCTFGAAAVFVSRGLCSLATAALCAGSGAAGLLQADRLKATTERKRKPARSKRIHFVRISILLLTMIGADPHARSFRRAERARVG